MNKNEIFTLWIPDNNENKLPLLAHLSLKSMILCGHDVILYTYSHLDNVPEGVQVFDANEIIDKSKIFRYKGGHKTLSGFANLFRLKRLYEYGGTWLDLDIILIRNINEKFDDDILICSEPTSIYYSKPNNAILRFPPKDPFVKSMLKYAEKRGNDIIHGETGPTLVLNTLKGPLYEYNRYLKNFNFNNLLRWNDLNDYSRSPKELLNNVNIDEIIGFHFVNTFFKKLLTSKNPEGLFEILKRIILNSNSKEDYYDNLRLHCITQTYNPTIKKIVSSYLDIIKRNSSNEFKYTFLIDSRNLKKIEIYNIIHSIAYDSAFDDLMTRGYDSLSDKQIIIFGKTNLANDKVKFKENILFISMEYNEIYPEINNYIFGEYIIPLNKPIIFKLNFFREKSIGNDIEHYTTNNPNSNVNIINKKVFEQLHKSKDIFNLTQNQLTEFNLVKIENQVFDYEYRSENVLKLMELIDEMESSQEFDSFLEVKHKLMKLNFKNMIDELSYHYYTSYNNIIDSSYYFEYILKEENTRLKCLNDIHLNKLNGYDV